MGGTAKASQETSGTGKRNWNFRNEIAARVFGFKRRLTTALSAGISPEKGLAHYY
jgi:hypothetical protein